MNKHTPYTVRNFPVKDRAEVVYLAGDYWAVCETTEEGRNTINTAIAENIATEETARLLASAPALLGALRELLACDFYPHGMTDGGKPTCDCPVCKAIDNARAAIARAEIEYVFKEIRE